MNVELGSVLAQRRGDLPDNGDLDSAVYGWMGRYGDVSIDGVMVGG